MSDQLEEYKNMGFIRSLLTLIIIVGIPWFYFGGGLEKFADKQRIKSGNKVASNAVKKYEIVRRNGNAIDVCSAAGFVSAAYLQIQDGYNYHKWKKVEEKDCKRAGLRF